MSQASGAHVYLGHWINWSRGAILGSTLTLSTRNGGLLTAFLAIFVSLAGASFWRITSYLFHQYRTSEESKCAIHLQEQLVLRNSTSPADAAWRFAQIGFFWRGRVPKSLLRSLVLVALALLNLVVFGLASIFSSEITRSAGNETLIVSSSCGFWSPRDPYDQSDINVTSKTNVGFLSKALNDANAAASYAKACYNNNDDILQCRQYTVPYIPWTVDQNASCPFADEKCLLGPTTAYKMDTGPINSHDVLGINAPVDARVTFRKITTCSPIGSRVELYNVTNKTSPLYGDRFLRFYLGEVVGVSNYTYSYNLHNAHSDLGYNLKAFVAFGGSNVTYDSFIPIPEIDRQDADISLFFLASNDIYYLGPVSDPLYSANIQVDDHWEADYYATVLGCIDQFQLCNPSNYHCTSETSMTSAMDGISKLNFTSRQEHTAYRLSAASTYLTMFNNVDGRGISALQASATLWERSQIALPNNQWMIEVSSWMAVSMARLQQSVVEYAAGPSIMPPGSQIISDNSPEGIAACRGQKIRSSTGIISFSMLGIAIILIVGWIFIVTSLVMSTVVKFLRRTFRKGEHKPLHWVLDDTFQMQRLAYEEAGQGTWTGGSSAIPVTAPGDRIGLPKGADRHHPRLSKPLEKTNSDASDALLETVV